MKLAIQTSLLPGDSLDAKFDAAARYGFDAVEINIGPNFDIADNIGAVRAAMTTSGLPVSAFCTHPIHDPFQPDPDERQVRFERLAHLLSLADELGAAGVVGTPRQRAPIAAGTPAGESMTPGGLLADGREGLCYKLTRVSGK